MAGEAEEVRGPGAPPLEPSALPRPRGPAAGLPEVVYGPESELSRPLAFLRAMGRDLLASRELAFRLMVRDLSAQYRQSFLGFLWAFLPPIFMAATLMLARDASVINITETDLPYPAYVMFSMTLWQTFVDALNGPIKALGGARAMMARVNFPREAVVLAKLGEVLFDFAIKLILIAALFIWFRIGPGWSCLLAPLALLDLVLLGTCLGLLLAPLAVLYQDVSKALGLLTGLWFWLTPVAYAPPSGGLFSKIVALNPVTPLLVTTRELASGGVVSYPQGFWAVTGLAVAGTFLAAAVFRLAVPYVVERVGS